MKTYIYTLDCPETKQIKYVGKTINPEQRIAQHLRSKENTKKYAWIKSLKNNGLKPDITIVDCIESEWEFWEDWYIQYYKFLGFELKNHKGGGIGGRLSYETRKKISNAHKGKKKSPEHKAKCIKNLINRPPSNKGKPMAEKQRKQLFDGLAKYIENIGYPRQQHSIDKIKTLKEDIFNNKKDNKKSLVQIAREHGVTIHIARDISRGKTWKNL
jgi:hypothetical protein